MAKTKPVFLKTLSPTANLQTHNSERLEELREIAQNHAKPGTHNGTHPTSREDLRNGPIELHFASVAPKKLAELAPWLEEWYRGPLLEAARLCIGSDNLFASEDPANLPIINIHPSDKPERYECHIDSCPFTVLMLIGEKDRSPETGGALAISNRGDVPSPEEVLQDCTRYYPRIGECAIMSGLNVSHLVEASTDGADRAMLVCMFWTEDVPESARAVGLAEYDQGIV